MNALRQRWIWFALAFAAWVGPSSAQELRPNPSLTPEQVVQVQIDALHRNDVPNADAGIVRSFLFASPSNRLISGPLDHFIEIVRSPAYSPLLNSISAAVEDSHVDGDQAKVLVQIVSGSGQEVYYLFVLSKQEDGEYRGCWMTDGVLRLEREDASTDHVAI